MGVIYKIINPIGQIYIGQTKSLDNRLKYYKYLECKNQKLLYKSLKHYGFEAHKIEVLKYCEDNKDLDSWEIRLIKENKSYYYQNKEIGLNLTKGGESTNRDRFGKNNPLFGRKYSEKHRKNISNSLKGKKRGKYSQERKNKISIALKGKKKSYIVKKNLKPILQYSLDGNFIKEYESAKQAQDMTKISKGNIGLCCKNKRKMAGNFIWKYK